MKFTFLSILFAVLIALTSISQAAPIVLTDSLLDAAQKSLDDSSNVVVRLSAVDLKHVVHIYSPSLRPDFAILVLRLAADKSVFALVPRSADKQNEFLNQQVMQWQVIAIDSSYITGFFDQQEDGPVIFQAMMPAVGPLTPKSDLVLTKKFALAPSSYNSLLQYIESHPGTGRPMINSSNAVNDGEKLLAESRVIVPGKMKELHVVGEIFTAELDIDHVSPYSGLLAPGQYHVIGRLSSGLKDLKTRNPDGSLKANSVAMGLLIYRTEAELEEPGVLFFQDSLVPVVNPGLSQYWLTNNPSISVPRLIQESLSEIGPQLNIAKGIVESSLNSARDSGRGPTKNFGNYRSTYGAAGNGVDYTKGETAIGPRYIALQFIGGWNQATESMVDSLKSDKLNEFALKSSEDGQSWSSLGLMKSVTWLGANTDELTFPHGLSGGTDPQTLRPSESAAGVGGVLVPNQ